MTAIIATYRHMTAADICDCIIVAMGVMALLTAPVWMQALGLING